MQCTNPKFIIRKDKKFFRHHKNPLKASALHPCGLCMACRINRSTEWADRLIHEMESWHDHCFVTLTYDNDSLPKGNLIIDDNYKNYIKHNYIDKNLVPPIHPASLKKKHIQDWIKRLRHHLDPDPIVYYICGEYGEHTLRPHYHAIMFGIGINKMKTLGNKLWGMCDPTLFHVDMCVPESIRYVTKYITKSHLGKYSTYYNVMGIEPPFTLCSQGIGARWAFQNEKRIKSDMYIISSNGTKHPIPRYYRKLLNITEGMLPEEDYDKTLSKQLTQNQREANLQKMSENRRNKL